MIWDFGSLCILKKTQGKRLFSTNQMAGNSKKVSLLRKFKNSLFAQWANFLEQRDFFEFPAIWLVENSLFPWDFFNMHKEPKSQIIRNRPLQSLKFLKSQETVCSIWFTSFNQGKCNVTSGGRIDALDASH